MEGINANSPDRYVPASTLLSRLDKIRTKAASLSQQLDELRREEKLLASLLEDAVEPSSPKPSGGSTREVVVSAGPRPERSKGVVEGILNLVRSKPGISRAELVEGLRYLNLNPFDQNSARRVILNNLGNQIRNGKIEETENGGLHLVNNSPTLMMG